MNDDTTGTGPDPGEVLDARLAARLAALFPSPGGAEAASVPARDDECCGSTWKNDRTTWHCTRDPRHDPRHEAAVGGHLLATWDETGGIEFPQCAEAPAERSRAYGTVPLSDLEVMNDGRPVTWSAACAPGGYVCAVPDDLTDDGICGNPVESEPCNRHGDEDTPPPVTPLDTALEHVREARQFLSENASLRSQLAACRANESACFCSGSRSEVSGS